METVWCVISISRVCSFATHCTPGWLVMPHVPCLPPALSSATSFVCVCGAYHPTFVCRISPPTRSVHFSPPPPPSVHTLLISRLPAYTAHPPCVLLPRAYPPRPRPAHILPAPLPAHIPPAPAPRISSPPPPRAYSPRHIPPAISPPPPVDS